MPIGYENVPVPRDRDVGRPIEDVGAFAGHAGLTEGQHEFPVRTELQDRMTLAVAVTAVGHVDVALVIHGETVRVVEHVGTEALEQPA